MKHYARKQSLPLIFLVFAMAAHGHPIWPFTPGCSVEPSSLLCEYLPEPLGLDMTNPRLSWRLVAAHPARRGQQQTAYQILVAASEQSLRNDKGDLWDSGDVPSSESVNIVYAGKPLSPDQQCFWKVRVADEKGVWSDWSAPARWTIGLPAETDWKAEWIGAAYEPSGHPASSHAANPPDPWLRKTFELPARPLRAAIYVASVGYHELYVNGQKVGTSVLEPCATDNRVRARYVTYEIGKYLRRGHNIIGIWLGTSWSIFPPYHVADRPDAYEMEAFGSQDLNNPVVAPYELKDRPWGPMVLAQADIQLPKDRKLEIVTDSSWKTRPSPTTLLGTWDANSYGGEEYDARRELPNWCSASLDDSGWKSAAVFHPQLKVSAEIVEPDRPIKKIQPVGIQQVADGVYRVDMGVNYTGWFQMRLTGKPGQRIQFQFSERENEPMTYGLHSVYVLGPSGKGTFCNRFNYEAGRWVQITGLKKRPSLDQISGWLIRTDYRRTGAFKCDQPLLNRIYDTTLWTFENLSLGSYVVDCPHRERRGYGGDAHSTIRTALDNYSMGAFYTTWAQDWRDVQQPDGNVPYTAPTYTGGGGPPWSGFCITLPWEIYRYYGDTRILQENFPMMQRWLAFLETKSTNNLLKSWGGLWDFLGDWSWAGFDGSKGDLRTRLFFNDCYWIFNLETASRAALVLGNKQAAEEYHQRAQTVRMAVQQAFFNPKDNSYANGNQSSLGIALLVDLPPKELLPAVWRRLEQQILTNDKGHIGAGITGGALLMRTLLANDRNDLVYTMASKQDYPGWGDMLEHGATTFYEAWNGDWSHLHSSYIYIGSWFIEGLGGIRPLSDGFKHFAFEPWINPDTGLHDVSASYDSAYGRISMHWHLQDDTLRLNLVVPPNTDATVKLPINEDSISCESRPLQKVTGVTAVQTSANGTLFKLDSGQYEFVVQHFQNGVLVGTARCAVTARKARGTSAIERPTTKWRL